VRCRDDLRRARASSPPLRGRGATPGRTPFIGLSLPWELVVVVGVKGRGAAVLRKEPVGRPEQRGERGLTCPGAVSVWSSPRASETGAFPSDLRAFAGLVKGSADRRSAGTVDSPSH